MGFKIFWTFINLMEIRGATPYVLFFRTISGSPVSEPGIFSGKFHTLCGTSHTETSTNIMELPGVRRGRRTFRVFWDYNTGASRNTNYCLPILSGQHGYRDGTDTESSSAPLRRCVRGAIQRARDDSRANERPTDRPTDRPTEPVFPDGVRSMLRKLRVHTRQVRVRERDGVRRLRALELRVRAVPLSVRHVRVPVEELTARELARQGGFLGASAVVVARRFSSVDARERDIDVPTPSRGAPDNFVFLYVPPPPFVNQVDLITLDM